MLAKYEVVPTESQANHLTVSMHSVHEINQYLTGFPTLPEDSSKAKGCSATTLWSGINGYNVPVELYNNLKIGFVLDPRLLIIPQSDFIAYRSGGKIAPEKLKSESVYYEMNDGSSTPLTTKYRHKKIYERQSNMGQLMGTNIACNEHLPTLHDQKDSVYHENNGSLRVTAKNIYRKFNKRFDQFKNYSNDSSLMRLNEVMAFQQGTNPITGIIITEAPDSSTSDQLIAILTNNPHLNLYFYNPLAEQHIARLVDNQRALDYLRMNSSLASDDQRHELFNQTFKTAPPFMGYPLGYEESFISNELLLLLTQHRLLDLFTYISSTPENMHQCWLSKQAILDLLNNTTTTPHYVFRLFQAMFEGTLPEALSLQSEYIPTPLIDDSDASASATAFDDEPDASASASASATTLDNEQTDDLNALSSATSTAPEVDAFDSLLPPPCVGYFVYDENSPANDSVNSSPLASAPLNASAGAPMSRSEMAAVVVAQQAALQNQNDTPLSRRAALDALENARHNPSSASAVAVAVASDPSRPMRDSSEDRLKVIISDKTQELQSFGITSGWHGLKKGLEIGFTHQGLPALAVPAYELILSGDDLILVDKKIKGRVITGAERWSILERLLEALPNEMKPARSAASVDHAASSPDASDPHQMMRSIHHLLYGALSIKSIKPNIEAALTMIDHYVIRRTADKSMSPNKQKCLLLMIRDVYNVNNTGGFLTTFFLKPNDIKDIIKKSAPELNGFFDSAVAMNMTFDNASLTHLTDERIDALLSSMEQASMRVKRAP